MTYKHKYILRQFYIPHSVHPNDLAQSTNHHFSCQQLCDLLPEPLYRNQYRPDKIYKQDESSLALNQITNRSRCLGLYGQ